MTDSYIPNAEELDNLEPDRDNVVYMESDEGVRFRINLVSGFSESETRKQTYTRGFGHYFVADGDDCCEVLDDIVSDLQEEQKIISGFQRLIGQTYEVQVEIDDDIDQMESQFNGTKNAVIEIPSHSKYIEDAREFLDELRDE